MSDKQPPATATPDDQEHRKSIGCWLGIAAFIGIAMYLVIPVVMHVIELKSYYRLHDSTRKLIDAWSEKRPSDVPPKAWEHATDWTKNAFDNIFFSPSDTSFSELEKFRADLEVKLKEKANLETVDWIWKRLAETGPHGKRYVEQYQSRYREVLPDSSGDGCDDAPQ